MSLVQAVLGEQAGDKVPLGNVQLQVGGWGGGGGQRRENGASERREAAQNNEGWAGAGKRLCGALPGHCATHLLFNGVAPELHHLQAVQQRRRDVGGAVGGGDKQRAGEVEGLQQ